MIKELTDLVIIIDVDTELYRYKDDVIEGLNLLIDSQKIGVGKLNLTTVLVSDNIVYTHNRYDVVNTQNVTADIFDDSKPTKLGNVINWDNGHYRFVCTERDKEEYFIEAVNKIMKYIETSHTYIEEVEYADPNMIQEYDLIGKEKNAAGHTMIAIISNKWSSIYRFQLAIKLGPIMNYYYDTRNWDFLLLGNIPTNLEILTKYYRLNEECFKNYDLRSQTVKIFECINNQVTNLRKSKITFRKRKEVNFNVL